MPTTTELIAHDRSIEEIREFIGADKLIYQDVAAMKRVVAALNPKLDGFEASCFDGVYIAGEASAEEVAAMAAGRKGRGDEDDGVRRPRRADAAERSRARLMAERKIPRKALAARPRAATRSPCARACRRAPWGENSEALFLTSSFVQPDAATAAARFANEEEAFIYSRFTNPTVTMMERRLAALEGTEACIATSSGMSAILLLGMGLLKAGDHVVCSQSVFGSTMMLFGREFAKFGVETTFVSQTDVGEWRAAMRPNTKLLFAESPTNPLTEVCDIRALADIAHGAGAGLAVDNCFCTPALQRPVDSAPTSSSTPAPSTSTGRAASSPARSARARASSTTSSFR